MRNRTKIRNEKLVFESEFQHSDYYVPKETRKGYLKVFLLYSPFAVKKCVQTLPGESRNNVGFN